MPRPSSSRRAESIQRAHEARLLELGPLLDLELDRVRPGQGGRDGALGAGNVLVAQA
jgi:hypothetical protein